MKGIRSKLRVMPVIAAVLIVICWPLSANACELLYSGGDMTDDGANMFMRTEEIGPDDNKIYYVSPAGNHVKGEKYRGCTDFVWTFTHDSYRYTARRDDNLSGVCPDCDGTHEHTPYEEAGTNDHGVTVSATNSLNANPDIKKADPFADDGIEESEMATVLLSEAASAREGVELLTGIYAKTGAGYEGSGVMICDQNEQWYVECLSGHEYIAVLLPPDVTFMQFNVSVLGRIDLDDTDHVIASKHLFDVAKKAGTFVGDEKENIIDFRASYNDYMMKAEDEDWPAEWREHVQERLAAGLNFLEDTEEWNVDNVLKDNDFIMTNIGEDGGITSLHNQLALKEKMSLDQALALFRVYPIGYEENVNTHLYRFYPEEEQVLGTVEWFAMDNCTYNVFIPSYPMLLTDTWEGYKVPLDETEVTEKKPKQGDWYLNDGEYHIHPDGWDKSYIGTLSALTNLLTYGNLSEEDVSLAEDNLQSLQQDLVTRFDELSEEIREESSQEAREELMTNADMEMAQEVHDLALALYRYFTNGEESDLISNGEKHFPIVPVVIVLAVLAAAAIAWRAYIRKGNRS